jgi:hypothetical protein
VTDSILTQAPKIRELMDQRDISWFNAKLSGKSYNEIAMDPSLNPDRFTAQGISFSLVKYCRKHNISTDVLKGGDK